MSSSSGSLKLQRDGYLLIMMKWLVAVELGLDWALKTHAKLSWPFIPSGGSLQDM